MSPWSSHNVLLASLTLFPLQFLILCPFLEKKKSPSFQYRPRKPHLHSWGLVSESHSVSGFSRHLLKGDDFIYEIIQMPDTKIIYFHLLITVLLLNFYDLGIYFLAVSFLAPWKAGLFKYLKYHLFQYPETCRGKCLSQDHTAIQYQSHTAAKSL